MAISPYFEFCALTPPTVLLVPVHDDTPAGDLPAQLAPVCLAPRLVPLRAGPLASFSRAVLAGDGSTARHRTRASRFGQNRIGLGPGCQGSSHPAVTELALPAKKRRIVQAARLTPKDFLETQADVDDYLGKLRKALETAIISDERVEIR
jgi:hypothetical protein